MMSHEMLLTPTHCFLSEPGALVCDVRGTKLVGSLTALEVAGGGPKLKLLVCTGPSLDIWGARECVRFAPADTLRDRSTVGALVALGAEPADSDGGGGGAVGVFDWAPGCGLLCWS
jgi:hypothetical protein